MIKMYESKQKETRCNVCGKLLDEFDILNGFSIGGKIGYGSEFDGDDLDLNLCCDCMDSLIKRCEVSPLVK